MADTYIIPPVGSKGRFTFKEPFNQEDYENQELTVSAVRTLKELQDNNIDVYKTIYALVGLSENDFLTDFANSVPIVVFASTANNYLYVPANRVSGLPDTSGVKYQEVILAINLGLLPLGYDLELVKSDTIETIHDRLGVQSTVQEVKSSGIMLIDPLEDDKFMRLLENKKTENLSYRTRYYRLLEQYNSLRKLYEDLEQYVIQLKNSK